MQHDLHMLLPSVCSVCSKFTSSVFSCHTQTSGIELCFGRTVCFVGNLIYYFFCSDKQICHYTDAVFPTEFRLITAPFTATTNTNQHVNGE